MARQTLEKLIHGDENIVAAYSRIKEKWDEILGGFNWEADDAIEKMAELVSFYQIPMEHIVGERWLGQEIMVIVGIGQFYNSEIGFDASSRQVNIVYKGFLTSMCSLEVKYHAETIGELYKVNYYSEENFKF